MLALDLVEPIAERIEKILVGRDDRPIKVEFDHGLRAADCLNMSLCIDAGFTTEHFIAPKLMLRLRACASRRFQHSWSCSGLRTDQLLVRDVTLRMKHS